MVPQPGQRQEREVEDPASHIAGERGQDVHDSSLC
jgi:hypothetical protein